MGKKWQIFFLGSKITVEGDCSHEIRRCLVLKRKTMTNLDSILKSRHHLPANVGSHHQLSGPEFEQTPGDSEGQRSLACCSPWGCRVGHGLATEQQHLIWQIFKNRSLKPSFTWFQEQCSLLILVLPLWPLLIIRVLGSSYISSYTFLLFYLYSFPLEYDLVSVFEEFHPSY